MPENKNLVQCYNRGCGKSFDPNDNTKDDCQHHPGLPVFHDAYKGWSCCNKKSVDFTEFLNIKGCTFSKHSNEKPPEPEKKPLDKELDSEIIIVKGPEPIQQLTRPPFEDPLVNIQPCISESLKASIQKTSDKPSPCDQGVIEIGTSCKNNGCNGTYDGPDSNIELCTYHPGCPIFHEGLKFWSCCQKRTTDFNVFLSQPGCTTGTHKWIKETGPAGTVKCRWDWHQTPDYVIISIYAKKYDPMKSYIKLNPIRLNTKIVFPEQGDNAFDLDIELRGIISIKESNASMSPSKIEIKLRKAEPGSWSKLDFPRTDEKKLPETSKAVKEDSVDDDVDLSSIEAVPNIHRINISELEQVE